jgi:hypothetical protein
MGLLQAWVISSSGGSVVVALLSAKQLPGPVGAESARSATPELLIVFCSTTLRVATKNCPFVMMPPTRMP